MDARVRILGGGEKVRGVSNKMEGEGQMSSPSYELIGIGQGVSKPAREKKRREEKRREKEGREMMRIGGKRRHDKTRLHSTYQSLCLHAGKKGSSPEGFAISLTRRSTLSWNLRPQLLSNLAATEIRRISLVWDAS
jgi:hypothetical protein